MAIRDWPKLERPREKLLARGARALSDAELLAIFLRTGCSGRSAVDLARDLLSEFGSLRRLLDTKQDEFCRAKGLGLAKFTQLQAVLEMSRRHLGEALVRESQFDTSVAVKDFLTSQLRHKQSEVFAAMFLDSLHRLICYEELFQGTIDGANVYCREVVKAALKYNAASIIFAHNHPSGIAEPSQADKNVTDRLIRALALIDVRVIDHVIVGEGQITSFAERGLL